MRADACADAPGYELNDMMSHVSIIVTIKRIVAHRACAIQRASLFTARRHLSLFAVNSFLPLQFRGSSSDVIRGFSQISARDTNGSIACIGNYSNSTGCS